MNDKEKLISFINKGKENKPVKEVHVIKDSPTEAHILLVNEDGTNVASNRFEIMDANDLMTLIENSSMLTGMDIYFNETNNKLVFKNHNMLKFVDPTTFTIDKPIPESLAELKGFNDKLVDIYDNYGAYFYMIDGIINEEELEFNTFIQNIQYLVIFGANFNNGSFPFSIRYYSETDTINIYYINGEGVISYGEYNNILAQYNSYSSDGSKIIINFNF